MITYRVGNMFGSQNENEAIINTVNCVGVMGKGVALAFKEQYPENFRIYKEKCKSKNMNPGKMLVTVTNLEFPKYIINFPTKLHWRNPSKIEYISEGLDDLVKVIKRYNIQSLVMPALGCGNGQLDWKQVKPLIENKLSDLNIDITVYEPTKQNDKDKKKKPPLTKGRALLLLLIDKFNMSPFAQQVTYIEANLLAYLIQTHGETLGLSFEMTEYGPYDPRVNNVLKILKDTYIEVKKQNHAPTAISVNQKQFKQKNKLLKQEKFKGQLKSLETLINGFETSESLMLLSVIYWFYKDNMEATDKEIYNLVHNWFQSYNHSVSSDQIRRAINRIRSFSCTYEDIKLNI